MLSKSFPSHSDYPATRREGPTIPARLAIGLIGLYRLALSPVLGSHCRFAPSCSAYTATAIARYGAIRGCWLGVRRLARCHPFHPGGYDPVR